MHPRVSEANLILYLQLPIGLNKSTPKEMHVRQKMHYLLTLFYVHINTMGIALWKEKNNSMLKQVLRGFGTE